VFLWVGPTGAGELNPPSGPIAPTDRTPIADSTTPGDAQAVHRITLSGSYYLRGNVTGVAGKHGIVIGASNVTLDLNGFEVVGVVGSFDGISTAPSGQSNIAVRNGTVRAWGSAGIGMSNSSALLVEGVRAVNNGSDGLLIGTESVVRNCISNDNVQEGIQVSPTCTVVNCTASGNRDGFLVSVGSTVSGCTANDNLDDGFAVLGAVTVEHCTAVSNDDTGFESTGPGNTLVGCTARDNGEGAATTNKHGFALNANATLVHCTAYSNNGDGINATDGSTIRECTASFNGVDGIRVSDDNLVIGNNCDSNGVLADGAGVHATGTDNRVEGNNVIDNDFGLDVDLSGNFIIRNSATSNGTNYEIAANNVGFYVSGTNTAAVSGSSGGTTIGTTDPWANISY
jgi:parallel beta-helix repeat protein